MFHVDRAAPCRPVRWSGNQAAPRPSGTVSESGPAQPGACPSISSDTDNHRANRPHRDTTMASTTFDTLTAARDLEAAGVDRR